MTRSSNIVSKYAKRTVFKNRSRSILTLIGIVQDEVLARFGVHLETEVRILGED